MAKNAMPVSKAKTAYGLLSEIRADVLAEPLVYDQRFFRITKRDLKQFYPVIEERPKCGTTACVAGHVCLRKSPRTRYDDMQEKAADILGLDYRQAVDLFNASSAGERPGDVEGHAKRGAAHIAKFQKKYAKQLRAKKV